MKNEEDDSKDLEKWTKLWLRLGWFVKRCVSDNWGPKINKITKSLRFVVHEKCLFAYKEAILRKLRTFFFFFANRIFQGHLIENICKVESTLLTDSHDARETFSFHLWQVCFTHWNENHDLISTHTHNEPCCVRKRRRTEWRMFLRFRELLFYWPWSLRKLFSPLSDT